MKLNYNGQAGLERYFTIPWNFQISALTG